MKSLRVRLAVASAGLLLVSLSMQLILVNHDFEGHLFDHPLWVTFVAWLGQATLWLGLISAAGAVAAWIVDGSAHRPPAD